jgi:hypothetical protein
MSRASYTRLRAPRIGAVRFLSSFATVGMRSIAPLRRVVVAEYVDERLSAFSGNRGPGLVDAMQHAGDLTEAHGSAELWVQHRDRLARGDGRAARHAVEIGLWALKREVAVRCVQDPDTFRDLLYAVVTGQRNHEDSRRRGLAMAAGRRRAAERGDFIGYLPDGYKFTADMDERGHVKKRMVIDPTRRELFPRAPSLPQFIAESPRCRAVAGLLAGQTDLADRELAAARVGAAATRRDAQAMRPVGRLLAVAATTAAGARIRVGPGYRSATGTALVNSELVVRT